MTRAMVRKLVICIMKEDPHHSTLFKLEKGPTDEWLRKFVSRHSERTPGARPISKPDV